MQLRIYTLDLNSRCSSRITHYWPKESSGPIPPSTHTNGTYPRVIGVDNSGSGCRLTNLRSHHVCMHNVVAPTDIIFIQSFMNIRQPVQMLQYNHLERSLYPPTTRFSGTSVV